MWSARARELAPAILVVCALAGAAGCSLLLTVAGAQCATDGDCQRRGGAFAQSVCTADGVCRTLDTEPERGPCTKSSECNGLGSEPSACIGGRCVGLRSADCTTIYGDIRNDEAVLLGLFTPLSNVPQSATTRSNQLIDSLVADFNAEVAKLPAAQGRAAVLVQCDEIANPKRAAAHLIDDLHVRGAIGPRYAASLLDVAQTFISAGVPIVTADNDDPEITAFATSRATFAVKPLRSAWLRAAQATAARAIAVQRGRSGDPIKLALVVQGDRTSQEWANAALPAIEAAAGGAVTRIDFADPVTVGGANSSQITEALSAALPNVVVLVGDPPTTALGNAEYFWPGSERPLYLTLGRNAALVEAAGAKGMATVHGRILALDYVRPASSAAAEEELSSRYSSRWATTLPEGAAWTNDALFLLQYGLHAAAAKVTWDEVDAAAFADALPRVLGPEGIAYPASRGAITSVLSLLATSDGNVALSGLGTSLTFGGGNAPSADLELYCYGTSSRFTSTGVTYDAGTGAEKNGGGFTCP